MFLNLERLFIICATNISLYEKNSKCVIKEFEMSMMEKLNFFLGHKIKHTNHGIFISQNKCTSDILKRFEIELKPTTTPMSSSIKLDKDNQGILVDIAEY